MDGSTIPGDHELLQLLFDATDAVAGVVVTRLGTTGDTTLGQILSLNQNTLGLVVAAVFGLTPNLLIANLHSKAESYKTDLKSSKASQSAPMPP